MVVKGGGRTEGRSGSEGMGRERRADCDGGGRPVARGASGGARGAGVRMAERDKKDNNDCDTTTGICPTNGQPFVVRKSRTAVHWVPRDVVALHGAASLPEGGCKQ